MNRLTQALVGALIFIGGFAQAASVDVVPGTVLGLTIVSAELVPDPDSSAEILVVRLRNDGAVPGQRIDLSAQVRDAAGYGKEGWSNRIEIRAAVGSEQISTYRIESSLHANDTLTLALTDVAADLGNLTSSGAGGDGCPTCEWCMTAARLLCGDRGVQSFSCNCTTGSCSFTCND